MSLGFNTLFVNNTRFFLQNILITGTTIQGAVPSLGATAFDIVPRHVGGVLIATLVPFNPAALGPGFHEPPILAYWVPQGGSTMLPVLPGAATFVFTPDFSGCSLMVDQLFPTVYRVYHVQGGHELVEYLNVGRNHGLGQAGGMNPADYAIPAAPRAFAFMKHSGGRWWIYYQCQNHIGIGYTAATDTLGPAVGPLTLRGGGKIPLADIRTENARLTPDTDGLDFHVPRNPAMVPFIQTHHRRMLPNERTW